jgi:hypothetical protein
MYSNYYYIGVVVVVVTVAMWLLAVVKYVCSADDL